MPTPADFLIAFSAAASKPIVKPVLWPESIPADHPIRSLSLCVRFWPVTVAATVLPKIQAKDADWFDSLYWYIIAATVCNTDGDPSFVGAWPKIWTDLVTKGNTDAGASTAGAAEYIGSLDENNNLVIPPPDYRLIGDWLKETYSTPQGRTIMDPLWDQAMKYNGWGPVEGKNSETTDTSVLSGERVKEGA